MKGRHLWISLLSNGVGMASSSHNLPCIELIVLSTSDSVTGLNLLNCGMSLASDTYFVYFIYEKFCKLPSQLCISFALEYWILRSYTGEVSCKFIQSFGIAFQITDLFT